MFQISFVVLGRWLSCFRQALLTWVWSLWPTWWKSLDSYKFFSDLHSHADGMASSPTAGAHARARTHWCKFKHTKCSLPTILLHSFVHCSYPMMLWNTRYYSLLPCPCRLFPPCLPGYGNVSCIVCLGINFQASTTQWEDRIFVFLYFPLKSSRDMLFTHVHLRMCKLDPFFASSDMRIKALLTVLVFICPQMI